MQDETLKRQRDRFIAKAREFNETLKQIVPKRGEDSEPFDDNS